MEWSIFFLSGHLGISLYSNIRYNKEYTKQLKTIRCIFIILVSLLDAIHFFMVNRHLIVPYNFIIITTVNRINATTFELL